MLFFFWWTFGKLMFGGAFYWSGGNSVFQNGLGLTITLHSEELIIGGLFANEFWRDYFQRLIFGFYSIP